MPVAITKDTSKGPQGSQLQDKTPSKNEPGSITYQGYVTCPETGSKIPSSTFIVRDADMSLNVVSEAATGTASHTLQGPLPVTQQVSMVAPLQRDNHLSKGQQYDSVLGLVQQPAEAQPQADVVL